MNTFKKNISFLFIKKYLQKLKRTMHLLSIVFHLVINFFKYDSEIKASIYNNNNKT